MDKIDPKAELDNVTPITKKGKGASAERMRELTRIRLEKIANGDTKAAGGRRRIRLTDDEVKAAALEKAADALVPHRAKAMEKLAALLDSSDSGDRKFAIKTILEYTDGKPTQVIENHHDGPIVIEYQTAALPAPFVPMVVEDADSG